MSEMTDEEKERRYTKFFGEEVAPLRAIMNAPWAEHIWGARMEGFGLGILDQVMEEASSLKDKDPPLPPRPEPKRQKIQRDEEQGTSQPTPRPETQGEQEQLNSPRPEPMEGEEEEEEQGSSQPPPPSTPPSEQAKVYWFNSWVTFPREEDNPATWISDEYGEWRPRSAFSLAPYYRNPDPEAPQYLDDMAEFYLEAARRLPIAQMPNLAGVLSLGGLLLGFNDPVTNIIVNAMYFMGKFSAFGALPPGTDPVRHAADKASYVDIARRSRAALVRFMVFYFRYLTEAQAKRYLRAARHDLTVAIALVEWHRDGEFVLPVSPDCSMTKTALRYAAKAAMLVRDPDDLVRLVTSRYPGHLLDPVLDDLRLGEQLSIDSVNDILNLLKQPWSPRPPLPAPTPGTFRDTNGNVTIIINIGQDLFSTTTITKDLATAFNDNRNEDIVTTTTISSHLSNKVNQGDWLADTDHLSYGSDTKTRFESCLRTTSVQQLRHDMNLIMMCILDTIHNFYIQALAMLPSDHQPGLLHAVLAAGHCYGFTEDPVHNIIINSIWYNLRYLPSKDETVQIHHTRSMTRIVSCSLHGLIALILASHGSISTEQGAVLFLRDHNLCCNTMNNSRYLLAAAQAAKHPQPADLVKFMECLLVHKDRLRSLMSFGRRLSNTDFYMLSKMIADASAPVPKTPDLCQLALMDPGCRVQAYVRKKLEELLLNYGCKDPLGPQYKLGIICGVASKIFSLHHRDTTCYHANFMASTGDVPESSPACRFFAEFWDQAVDGFEQSKRPPVCCPLSLSSGYIRRHCRCFICESAAITVEHPTDVNYFMGHQVPTDALCAAAEHEAALGGTKVQFENRL